MRTGRRALQRTQAANGHARSSAGQLDAKAAEADWSAVAKERTSRRDTDVAARRNYRRSDEVEDLGCLL